MKTVRLITCNDSFQAHLVQGALKNEGIDSILQNDNTSGVLRGYISPISGVDIFVAEEQRKQSALQEPRYEGFPIVSLSFIG